MTIPLFCSPINVRNRPIPTVIACCRLCGIASLKIRYSEVNATMANSTPVTTTTARASRQSSFMECTSVYVKKALIPMPGTTTIGVLPPKAIIRHPDTAVSSVATIPARSGIPASCRIAALTITIYTEAK
ncbi:hypothetical protein D3C73_1167930 [compost metagenome]